SLATGEGRICNDCKNKKKSQAKKKAARKRVQTRSEVEKSSLECPRCNSPMVLKKGRYGKFYGCSTYPKCRGTRKYSSR
ncbi:topoisomerase DNA-binding C4 zinc finger domain-containing protein, partial [Thermodesulfobacteriota bacterium]